jgi:alkylation response protein AidB-like acyl-CoA dehydrogenase
LASEDQLKREASTVALPNIEPDFGFREEHELGRRAARRVLAERCPPSELRRLADDKSGFDPAFFQDIGNLGWIGLVTPGALGGQALDHLHLALLLDEMGRCLLPSPYLGGLLALCILERAGSAEQQALLGPAISSGQTIATVAWSEPNGSYDELCTTAERRGDGFLLRGIKSHVLFGQSADICIVPALERERIALFVVELPTQHARVEPEVCVDTTRRTARLVLEGVQVAAGARLEGEAEAALRAAHTLGWAALAAEMVGGTEAVLQKTRDYATERVQFGRPIGAFQAVKYPLVDMMVGVELGRSLALGAAAALDRDRDHAAQSARMAKAYAGDVYSEAVRKGVQLHGGYGFTIDCDVHFYFKRALWSRATLGDATHHRQRLAESLLGKPVP